MKIPNKKGEWILIKKRIPVKEFIQPLSIFYGIPDYNRLFFKDENKLEWNTRDHSWLIEYLAGGTSTTASQNAKLIIDRFNRNQKITSRQKSYLENKDPIELEYRMRIRTREGNVTIEPHEYNIVELSKYLEPVKENHAFIKYLNKNERITGKVGEQIFYLRSRGIGFVNAVMMTSGRIRSQNSFYIEMHKGYVEQFFGDYDVVEEEREAAKQRLNFKKL